MSKRAGTAPAKGRWSDINLTELVLLAQDLDNNAHRGLGRSALIALLEGRPEPLPTYRVDKYRLRIMTFLDANWERVEPLLKCPARSRDLRACFTCTDIQVAECSLNNPTIFKEKT